MSDAIHPSLYEIEPFFVLWAAKLIEPPVCKQPPFTDVQATSARSHFSLNSVVFHVSKNLTHMSARSQLGFSLFFKL